MSRRRIVVRCLILGYIAGVLGWLVWYSGGDTTQGTRDVTTVQAGR